MVQILWMHTIISIHDMHIQMCLFHGYLTGINIEFFRRGGNLACGSVPKVGSSGGMPPQKTLEIYNL